jgi:outer membrane receptor protein involved in Fe transport
LPLGSPLDGHAEQDLNQIPDSLIKRVEILTGGKSTLYGSDAIGGVINFILDRNFSGANISMHQGIYQHENNNKPLRSINDSAKGSVLDGLNSSYSFVAGDEVGQNTHLVGYIDYKSIESIRWDDRDIGVCAFRGNASCRLSSATYMARVQNGSNGGYVSN